jgi:outer membrane lipoprotein carrier protein
VRALLAILVLGLFSAVACGGEGAPTAALAKRLASLASLSGRFEQTVSGADSATPEASSGTFSLRRPDRFRWEITAPDQQLLVARDGILWHYDRDLATATRRELGDGSAAPLLLLAADREALADSFAVARLDDHHFRLEPLEPGAGFREATLRFEGALPVAMAITDRLGQQIDIRFSELSRRPVDEKAFRFTPPPGVEVYLESGAAP